MYIDVNTATKCLLILLICQTIFCNVTQWQASIHPLEALDQVEDPYLPYSLPYSPIVLVGNLTDTEIGAGESPR